jgi:myo-inositol-1(or 4)-monophosphatase
MDKRLVWIVDPIDGTAPSWRAIPTGRSPSPLADGQPVAGVVHAPALGALCEAGRGRGAFRNGETISASDRSQLSGARIAARGR